MMCYESFLPAGLPQFTRLFLPSHEFLWNYKQIEHNDLDHRNRNAKGADVRFGTRKKYWLL